MPQADFDMGQEPMEMPPQDAMPMEEPNPFERNFDAGVDADEDQDPKKYIQQLTGKLSQKLRDYNESQPQPDTDLNKYVAGMITKQIVGVVPEEDFDEIMGNMEDNNQTEQPNESIRHQREQINELYGTVENDDDPSSFEQPQGDITYGRLPFTAPQFT